MSLRLGHNSDEAHIKSKMEQRRSSARLGRQQRKAIEVAMETKLVDEAHNLRELKEEQMILRLELARLYGKKTMRYKKSITILNKISSRIRNKTSEKLETKFEHLKKKHWEAKMERESRKSPTR